MPVNAQQTGEQSRAPESTRSTEPRSAPQGPQEFRPGLLSASGILGALPPLRPRPVVADPPVGTAVDGSINQALRRRQAGGLRPPGVVADPMGRELGIDQSALRVHADSDAAADRVAGAVRRSRQPAYRDNPDPGWATPDVRAGPLRRATYRGQSARADPFDARQQALGPSGYLDRHGPLPAQSSAVVGADATITAGELSMIRRNHDAEGAAPDMDRSSRGDKPEQAATTPVLTIRRMARSDVKDHVHIRFSAMTVVQGWWVEPGTKGVVVDSSGDGDISIKLTTGQYAGETIRAGARSFDALPLAEQLDASLAQSPRPSIGQLQSIVGSVSAAERQKVAGDDALLARAKAALDEDTYLGLLPALGVHKQPTNPQLSQGGTAHTTGPDADKAIRAHLQQYVADAVKAGRKVEGEVSVVGDDDFQQAFDRQWISAARQNFGGRRPGRSATRSSTSTCRSVISGFTATWETRVW